MDSEGVGRRMLAIRKKLGWTLRQLCEKAGISQGQASRLENGKQRFRSDTLIRVAKALGVQPFELYMSAPEDGEAPAKPPKTGPNLRKALRDPEFAGVVEELAKSFRSSPARFRAMETVVSAVLGAR